MCFIEVVFGKQIGLLDFAGSLAESTIGNNNFPPDMQDVLINFLPGTNILLVIFGIVVDKRLDGLGTLDKFINSLVLFTCENILLSTI